MKYQIKPIENPPTADELLGLYESELYNFCSTEFKLKTNANLNSEYDKLLIANQ